FRKLAVFRLEERRKDEHRTVEQADNHSDDRKKADETRHAFLQLCCGCFSLGCRASASLSRAVSPSTVGTHSVRVSAHGSGSGLLSPKVADESMEMTVGELQPADALAAEVRAGLGDRSVVLIGMMGAGK